MTDPLDETKTAVKPAPKKKRRARRARSAKPAAPKAAAGESFIGLTVRECSADCRPDRCEITQMNICAHPTKCGLQSRLMNNPDILRRYNLAKKQLAHARVDRQAS